MASQLSGALLLCNRFLNCSPITCKEHTIERGGATIARGAMTAGLCSKAQLQHEPLPIINHITIQVWIKNGRAQAAPAACTAPRMRSSHPGGPHLPTAPPPQGAETPMHRRPPAAPAEPAGRHRAVLVSSCMPGTSTHNAKKEQSVAAHLLH